VNDKALDDTQEQIIAAERDLISIENENTAAIIM